MPAHAVRIRLGPVVVAAFLVVGPQLLVAASASADELFLPVAPPDGQTADAASVAATVEYQGATLRRRHARVDPGLLSEARASAARGGNAEGLIDLNLFDDAAFQVTDLETGPTSSGYSLSGQLDGVPFGTVTLVVNGDVIVGSVRAPGATYTIRSIAGGDVEIRQTDEGTLPECAGPRAVPPEAVAPGAVALGTDLAEPSVSIGSTSDPSQIDVLVVYTTAAKNAAGGEDAIEATIDLWFTEANGYFTASGVDLQIHLTHAEELDYVETSASYELAPLYLTHDGIMDRVHAMRDAVGADVVHLVERWGSSGRDRYCGVAYFMEDVDTSFARYAFGATVLSCGSMTFAHELGHNMGLNHDRYAHDVALDSGLTNKPYNYAYGYVNQAGFESGSAATRRWRTIMAYSTQCSHAGVSGCSRVGRFSNPGQIRSGDPLGVWSNGNASAVTGPADASLTLNGARATVAAFRSPGTNPAVVSLKRRQPAEEKTNGSTLGWRLAFNRDVKNVTSGDFELAGSGLGTTTLTVAAKTGSQQIYDIDVTAGLSAFNGEVTLGFAAGQNILDLSNRALDTTWPAAAERTYTLDHAAPSPAIAPSSASSSPFVATIRFAEDVEDFADAGDVTATNATVAAPSRSDPRTYTVQVTPTTIGASTVTLTVPADAAKDIVGNQSVAASQAVAYDPATTVSLAVAGLSKESIAENATWTSPTPSVTGSPVGTVSWTKEGTDAGHFEIAGATGVLTLPGRDFEEQADANGDNEYEVTVRATDANGNSATAQITVTVTDAVEARALRVSNASSRKVPETRSYSETPSLRPKVVCPDVCKVDEGPVGAVTWSKTGADAALFELDASSGDLSLEQKDFENPVDSNTDNDYEVTVSATDSDGNSASKDVTVRVTKGPPQWLTISGLASANVEENSAWTSGTPAAAGAGGGVIWTKVGPDAALFSIEAGNGVLAMAAQVHANPVDADQDNAYEVTVRATDEDGNSGAVAITVTITELSARPTISVDDGRALEGAGTLVFSVTLSRSSGSEVTVDYSTSADSGSAGARAGSDYVAASGTLTFSAGSTAAQEIVVDLTDDAEDEEEEETFRLTLGNARNASLAGGGQTLQVTGTIEDDDDPEVEVSFGSASYEATEGGTVNVVVRLNRDPERNVVVPLDRTPHGGVTDDDYSGVPASVTFGRGVRTREFLFAATDDSADDDGEAVVLSFGSLPSRVSGAGEATLAILDNDGGGGGGGGGSGGGGAPPPSDDDDDDGGDGTGGGEAPPRAAVTVDVECAENLCRAPTGVPVTFEDASTGRVQSRRWDFGDGTVSRDRRTDHAWLSPGFYEVTLSVSDGTTVSIASRVFLVGASDPAGTCEADAVTLCLQDSRYAVGVDWWTAEGGSGSASVVHSGTNDSGLFWFFNRDNWEILIKVLDGCALNGHVWVYGASTTDLGYTIRVTDTATGAVKEYRNEPGQPAPAITDATAFHACPSGAR